MPKSPSAVEVPVKEIFSRNYLFNIPGYQRPYAWTEQQARELFDDLWSFFQGNPEPAAGPKGSGRGANVFSGEHRSD